MFSISADPAGNKDQTPRKFAFRAPQLPYTVNDFVFGKLLGVGSYSKVVRVKKKDTEEEFALKIMDKRHIIKENKVSHVKTERLVLDQLCHPGLVRLFFTFQDAQSLYMGLECCHGGELFYQMMKKGRLSIDEASFYIAEIVEALEYIHGEGVIHRDLKPENILLTSDGHLKLADFGSAKIMKPLPNGFIQNDPEKTTFVGTAEYVSPEALNGRPLTIGADLWALGCIVYQMLEGKPPFRAASEYLTFQKVMARDFVMQPHFTPEARDLVNHLLDLDPERRLATGSMGYAALKAHPFFSRVKWSQLRESTPPKTAPLVLEETEDESEEESLDSDWELTQIGGKFASMTIDRVPTVKSAYSLGESEEAQLTTSTSRKKNSLLEECQAEKWRRFLRMGEELIATSLVKKYGGLSVKRRQLLLTNKPRLSYVHPVKLVLKGEIPWSNELYVQVENDYKFTICTPKRNYNLEDVKGKAHLWKEAIEHFLGESKSLS
ncbi:hypothetical protein O6H91_08G112400 [Diphasiastrum complanatum]|uniref:Uncharacterized protein n=1 Tax=Diphasiastrum complanatum TaxID=34168 RepID=A0ACC2D1K1_DIPCM|nr:hypothetical protein O6H91_08G112400 [Diphasiastrum complanatum]